MFNQCNICSTLCLSYSLSKYAMSIIWPNWYIAVVILIIFNGVKSKTISTSPRSDDCGFTDDDAQLLMKMHRFNATLERCCKDIWCNQGKKLHKITLIHIEFI